MIEKFLWEYVAYKSINEKRTSQSMKHLYKYGVEISSFPTGGRLHDMRVKFEFPMLFKYKKIMKYSM